MHWQMPTRIVHGPGTLRQLPAEMQRLGVKRPLIVSDAAIEQAGLVDEVRGVVRAAGLETVACCAITQDAPSDEIEAAARLYRDSGCDGVIALGGGSCLVAGKGVALLVANGGRLRDYDGMRTPPQPSAPVIAIPTTAGTGSEVSQMIPALDRERNHKMSIGAPGCFPRTAVLDPDLLRTLPQRQAAMTNIDGLSHAIEAYCTNLATTVTDALALGAIETYARHMTAAVLERDVAAQEQCLLASALANMACGNAKLGLAHAISHPMSGVHRVPHGIAIAVALAPVMAYNLPAVPERFGRMARALHPDATGPVTPEMAPERVRGLIGALGLPATLADIGIPETALPEIARRCAEGIYGDLDPDAAIPDDAPVKSPNIRPATVADIRAILATMGPQPPRPVPAE